MVALAVTVTAIELVLVQPLLVVVSVTVYDEAQQGTITLAVEDVVEPEK